MKAVYSILVVSLLIFATSCEQTQQVINTASNVQLNGNYTVNEVMGKNYSPKGLVVGFDALNKSFNATTECNNLFGTYTLDLYVINFGEIASTKKFCEGKMDAENELTQTFKATGSYSIENGILKLFSATDRSLLLTATKVRDTNEN
ncbi:MAG: META domain-containing protein [Flavobacteriales bacterium]|jgi:heat shock protein HslJ|nr:META domain-containing protein [Flavobacteriales bacterium]